MERKAKIKSVIGILLLLAFIVYYCVTAIVDLVSLGNSKAIDSQTMEINDDGISVCGDFHYISDGPIFKMKHSINYLIPTGNEYYFMLFSDDFSKAIFVRADEDFADTFYNGKTTVEMSKGKGYTITGKVRELDYKIKHEMSDYIEDLWDNNVEVLSNGSEYLFIDLTVSFQCTLRLITAFVFMLCTVFIIVLAHCKNFCENHPGVSKFLGIATVVLLIAGIISMVYTMSFLF